MSQEHDDAFTIAEVPGVARDERDAANNARVDEEQIELNQAEEDRLNTERHERREAREEKRHEHAAQAAERHAERKAEHNRLHKEAKGE
jgi:hypothetical protein